MITPTAVYLVFLSCIFYEIHGFSSRVTRSNKDIDMYINDMQYSRDQVLAYKGDSIDSKPVEREGKLDKNKCFIVITREKKSAFNTKADIGVVASNEHRAYPGSLMLANQRLIDNEPDLLVLDRANLTYTINLPGLTDQGHFTIEPTFANYQANKEKTLKTWFEQFPDDHTVIANIQSDMFFAYSMEYLRVKLGLEFKNTQMESNIDFQAMMSQEKLIVIHKFKQIFYTASVEPTKKPSDLFASGVSVTDVKRKTNSNNPPVIVDSVSYGRSIYVKFETTSTDANAKALISATGSQFTTENEAEMKKNLKNINMQVFILGGSTDQIKLITTQSFKEVNDILVQFGNFSRNNLGYPISYSSQFVKDNSRAAVNMATDYIDTSRTIHCKGIIKIVHKGAFVMQWSVTWKEASYDKNGVKVLKDVSWNKNWQDLTAPFEQEIELPGNAEDIRVFAREATGLAWEWWRTVIDRSDIPLIDRREFVVWGTTLSPDYSINPKI